MKKSVNKVNFWTRDYLIIRRGCIERRDEESGVAFNKEIGQKVTSYVERNECVILVSINVKPNKGWAADDWGEKD